MNGQWDWQQILAKYKFNLALLPVDSALTQLLETAPGLAGGEGRR